MSPSTAVRLVNGLIKVQKKRAPVGLIDIWANTIHADVTELHALLKKRQDPSIQSYTAFVRWTCKVRKTAE